MRTTIRATGSHEVTIHYDHCDTGERITREFIITDCGKLLERIGGRNVPMRLGLSRHGMTLDARWIRKMKDSDLLIYIVRAHYRTMRRDEKKRMTK